MLNEPNPFLCHPAVLGSRNCATCFLSQLFYSQFDIVKTWRQHWQHCWKTACIGRQHVLENNVWSLLLHCLEDSMCWKTACIGRQHVLENNVWSLLLHCWKIACVGRQRVIEDNMYWKIMFDRCYCINSTIYLLKFGKPHGSIFCHRLAASERVHIL